MIRYHVTNGDSTTTTDWEQEEVVVGPLSTAPKRLMALRQQYGPVARIRIERDVTPPRVPREWVRFVLTETNGSVRFTNPVLKSQADALAAELRTDYPQVTIGRQQWRD
jgi:hypothetical protein